MSYRQSLVVRWSGRDRLAVLVVAVTAAFLVGAVVVLLAVSGQTTVMAADHGSETAVSLTTTTGAEGTTFPLATATVDGVQRTVVGVPRGGAFGMDPPDGVAGPASNGTGTLVGDRATLERTVRERSGETPFPDPWLVTDAGTATSLGSDRALTLRASASPVPASGAPLTGALAFFLVGTRQMLGVLGVVCLGVAVLVGVVVFSVTRMTVRDRRSSIAVLRATGASRRRVALLVTARAGLLTLAGVTLGYAVGVVVPNAAVTAAVTLGFPVGLPLGVTPRAAGLIPLVLLALVGVGLLAGALAARSAVRGAPLDSGAATTRRWPGGPSFLPAGAAVPTTATLAVFAAFVLVVVALAGVVGGIGATGGASGGMVVEPGAVHPVDSHVPAADADRLRRSGVAASPEILLFLAHDGRPVPARGVEFDAYSAVTDARVVDGRAPNATDEAAVGTAFARTHGLAPGDELALGGSTTPAVGTVEVVGTFAADGASDDHLLVSLPLARHLEGVPEGSVNLVRYGEPAANRTTEGVVVLGTSAPRRVATDETVPVEVRLRNVDSGPASRTVRATLGDQRRTKRVTLDGGERRTVELRFDAPGAGTRVVTVGDLTRTVRVLSADTLVLAPLPEVGPPNATLRVGVGTAGGAPVGNATVRLGDRTARVGDDGRTRVRLPSAPGEYAVRVTAGNRSATQALRVERGARREPVVRLVTPNRTGVFTTPSVRVRVRNPWGVSLDRTLSVDGPGVAVSEPLELAPGRDRTVSATLDRRPPGEYTVQVTAGGGAATGTYRVTGDERLASAVASSDEAPGGVGAGGLLSRVFGNLWLVLATLVALGVVMTVGSTVAAFADAVQARRGDIGVHRAVGAGPRRIGRLVLGDALRIGLPAAAVSIALAAATVWTLSVVGTLTVFGVRVTPRVPLSVVGPLALGSLALALVSAGVVAWRYSSVAPSRLLGGSR
ncbi:FtsX-like permease family protein [Halostella salina]|uniref:FtsX-like permease family protein n=1 Tax=Halostella salina TaxID=1547897 RepID=UPI000EF79C82|nr:ABC transporter permease [Halostella salina]